MISVISYYISLGIHILIFISVYYYCIKIYGIKTTIITNLLLSSMILVMIFTGAYGIATLATDLNINYFWITDPISFFTFFILIFELARYSLKKNKGTIKKLKDIICVSILTSIYGICFQLIVDPTAAALGHYFFLDPPSVNIFGFPLWFIFSFSVYGLIGMIFLLIERYFTIKEINNLHL